ncbi:recombinase family protein [Paraburkholderia edwinii]|uniref:Recombinase family protein n=1 Tax=Paraburkholderia edwinii TaxID=2861782 RepID=A0ABX8UP69_9BURK|nr:recombinase family protein [Paraburkholderia edwinii]
MSTDMQEYSLTFQRDVIAEYASGNHLRIVETYEDVGISGLTLKDRPALTKLLVDVINPARRFSVLLVFDVSRWGRFQDVDESAFYEYTCRRAGVKVVYVAEPFENDGSPVACIMKTLKRAMAGELSRDMSRKVFLGICVNVQRGFHGGGPAPYGMQRLLVNKDGVKQTLALHEYKSVQTDRIVLTPGPAHEAALVRKIFEWYTRKDVSGASIAPRLNDFGIVNRGGRPWCGQVILDILRNETYIGTNVYSRTSSKLDSGWKRLPSSDWIRIPGAYLPLVDKGVFEKAPKKMRNWHARPTREDIIEGLQMVVAKQGRLNQKLLHHYRSAPSVEQVMHEFGSLYDAYKEIGYPPNLDPERSENRNVEHKTEHLLADLLLEEIRRRGHHAEYAKHTGTLCIDKTLRVQLVARSTWLIHGKLPYWVARWPDRFAIDFLVYGRIERSGKELIDFHIFPRGSLKPGVYTVIYRNGKSFFEHFRYRDLRMLLALSDTVPIIDVGSLASAVQVQ